MHSSSDRIHACPVRPLRPRPEMALILKDTNASFLDVEIIKEIDEVNAYLADSCGVGMLVSHVQFIKTARQAFDGGKPSGFRVPDTEKEVYFLCNKIMQTEWGGEFTRYMSLDKRHSRISGKLPDLTTQEFDGLTRKFDTFFKSQNFVHFDY